MHPSLHEDPFALDPLDSVWAAWDSLMGNGQGGPWTNTATLAARDSIRGCPRDTHCTISTPPCPLPSSFCWPRLSGRVTAIQWTLSLPTDGKETSKKGWKTGDRFVPAQLCPCAIFSE